MGSELFMVSSHPCLLLRCYVRALLHERAPVMPKAIVEGKYVFELFRLGYPGRGGLPFVEGYSARFGERAGECSCVVSSHIFHPGKNNQLCDRLQKMVSDPCKTGRFFSCSMLLLPQSISSQNRDMSTPCNVS